MFRSELTDKYLCNKWHQRVLKVFLALTDKCVTVSHQRTEASTTESQIQLQQTGAWIQVLAVAYSTYAVGLNWNDAGWWTYSRRGQAALPVSIITHSCSEWEDMTEATAPSPGPLPQCVHSTVTKTFFKLSPSARLFFGGLRTKIFRRFQTL